MTEGEGTQFGLIEASLRPTPQQLAASEAITLVCTPHAQHIPTCHPGNSSEVSHCALCTQSPGSVPTSRATSQQPRVAGAL